MKQLLSVLHAAGGALRREVLSQSVAGALLRPAKRRGWIEEDGDEVRLTARGRLIAIDEIPLIPEQDRVECRCGLVVDRQDEAQMDYIRRHQAGDRSTRVCPYFEGGS